MINPVKIPKGVANIFANDMVQDIRITDVYEHRPDKILDSIGESSYTQEMINNYMSNCSPISCVKKNIYTVCGDYFISFFGAFNG